MKTLWLTDIHLEFLDAQGLDKFYSKIEKAAAEALLISGDIGQAPNTIEFLRQLQVAAKCPVYFVFGNHDYGQENAMLRVRFSGFWRIKLSTG